MPRKAASYGTRLEFAGYFLNNLTELAFSQYNVSPFSALGYLGSLRQQLWRLQDELFGAILGNRVVVAGGLAIHVFSVSAGGHYRNLLSYCGYLFYDNTIQE
jgi:hypothetical protein